uniref:Uncharacterized protein n=1 Tax=Chlamydomonas euryale TaxID=1486919 RepID=A0A7R9VFG1_9CHLO|mmetsp:Transcript_34087/g.101369  ORF Transcript_34087/g.101369 Transcript_34087/m.101369 type:complete len:192 (+) Transcript_34087:404-979(+)
MSNRGFFSQVGGVFDGAVRGVADGTDAVLRDIDRGADSAWRGTKSIFTGKPPNMPQHTPLPGAQYVQGYYVSAPPGQPPPVVTQVPGGFYVTHGAPAPAPPGYGYPAGPLPHGYGAPPSAYGAPPPGYGALPGYGHPGTPPPGSTAVGVPVAGTYPQQQQGAGPSRPETAAQASPPGTSVSQGRPCTSSGK